MKKSLLLLVFAPFFTSCFFSATPVNFSVNPMLQFVLLSSNAEGNEVYVKSEALKPGQAGFECKPDGRFVEQASVENNGMPSNNYQRMEGEWKKDSDSLWLVKVKEGSGVTRTYKYHIVGQTNSTITIHKELIQ